ncbi:MAG: nucleotidyltransferase family protein [Elusimicrobia bacterium]|nr:nucleotidyltransferase family protein [Elusimicrobiota bacterium]
MRGLDESLPLLARNLFLLGTLRELLAEARKRGIPVIVLKGAALLCWLIEDPGARAMGDLDILVPEAKRLETERMLADLGYGLAPGTVEMFMRGTAVVDLHTSLLHRQDTASLWREAVPCSIEGEKALVLGPDETFIHLVARAFLQGGSLEEKYLDDLRRLAATAGGGLMGLDWDRVIGKALGLGLGPMAHAALEELARASDRSGAVLAGAPLVPDRVLAALKPSGAGRAAAWVARKAASRRDESYFNSAVLFTLVRPGFVLSRLFPNREFLERRYGENWKREALLRPFKLAARALGLR